MLSRNVLTSYINEVSSRNINYRNLNRCNPYTNIMAERHSKRSTIALWIAVIALLISLINLYLATELPGVANQ